MPDPHTTITELVTGLGMLGHDDVGDALAARPAEMVSVSPELWAQLDRWYGGRGWLQEFYAAFANGAAFLRARDGLRGRRPITVDWRGNAKPIDDELVPADLRVDHVYLVSCKYLSKIVANAAPARLFDGLLRTRVPAERTSWFQHVAPNELRALTVVACRDAGVEVVDQYVTTGSGKGSTSAPSTPPRLSVTSGLRHRRRDRRPFRRGRPLVGDRVGPGDGCVRAGRPAAGSAAVRRDRRGRRRIVLVWSGFECQPDGGYLAWTHVGTGVRRDP